MNFKVGIVGLGKMGRNHLRVLSEMENVEVIGILDTRKEVTREYKNQDIVCESLEILSLRNPDYVVVSTPISTHFNIASKLVELGINCLVEKTVTSSALECQQLMQYSTERGVTVLAAHIERYNPCVLKLKSLLEDSVVGEILSISTIRRGPAPERIVDVDVLQDIGIHDIDLIRWIMSDEFSHFDAQVVRRGDAKIHAANLLSSLSSSGCITTHELSWISPQKKRVIEMFGTKGSIVADLMNVELTIKRFESDPKGVDFGLIRTKGDQGLSMETMSIMDMEPLLRQHFEVQSYLNQNMKASVVPLNDALLSALTLERVISSIASDSK